MQNGACILVVEDDDAHSVLIDRNLRRTGIEAEMLRFRDGQEVLDFLLMQGDGPRRERHRPYVLLLDIRMPRVNGIEVLQQVKQHPELCKTPVIVLSTSDNPLEVEQCYRAGCSNYVVKPVDYELFVAAVTRIGEFLGINQFPLINGAT